MYNHVVSTTLIYSPTKKHTIHSFNSSNYETLPNKILKRNALALQYMWDTDFQPILAHQFRNWFMIFLDLNACYTHTQGAMNAILLGSNFVASQVIDDMNIQRSTDKLLNHVEFQCCFAKLSACSSELANCLQKFYRWMPYQRACRAFQCIDHFLETGRPLWTYSLYLDQLPFTGDLNDFEVVDQFYVYFVIFFSRRWASELQTSAVSDFPDGNLLRRSKYSKKKHIEAWKMKDPAWWYNIVEEWILAYII